VTSPARLLGKREPLCHNRRNEMLRVRDDA
jgi:hypothetical protein